MNPTQHKNIFLKVAGFVSAFGLASAASTIALSSGPIADHTTVLADFPPSLQSGTVELYQGTMYKPNMMSLQVDQYKKTKTINQKLSQDYDRRIQSIVVGPRARVKLYNWTLQCAFSNRWLQQLGKTC
eukprot:403358610